MKIRTTEWIEKAEGDFTIALREMAAPDPVWDGICFHAQQCVEKYLKALLEEREIAFSKTHDLVYLLDLMAEPPLPLSQMRADLAQLGTFGIAARYPGVRADKESAELAVRIARRVRTVIREALGLTE